MLIKLTAKEMATLALALQERPNETREDSKKIVPPETESRNGFSVGDLVICGALDEWAGPKTVFTVSGFYGSDVVVEDGKRTFIVKPEELARVVPVFNDSAVDCSEWLPAATIVPEKRLDLHQGQVIRLRGSGVTADFKSSVEFDCECLVLGFDSKIAFVQTVDGPVFANIKDLEAVEDAKA